MPVFMRRVLLMQPILLAFCCVSAFGSRCNSECGMGEYCDGSWDSNTYAATFVYSCEKCSSASYDDGRRYMDESYHHKTQCKYCNDKGMVEHKVNSERTACLPASDAAGTSCGTGEYIHQEECKKCPTGYYQPEGYHTQNACSECGEGEIPNERSSGCVKCEAGQYKFDRGVCKTCDAGFISNAKHSACTECPKGFYTSGGASECTGCESGQFASTKKSTACKDCAEGHWSTSEALTCKLCTVGKFATKPKSKSCADCDAGKFQDENGKSECKLCAAGKTTTQPMQSSCSNCSIGKYLSEIMRGNACLECTASITAGATRCPGCEAGKFKKHDGEAGTDDGDVCATCPLGKYSPGGGQPCLNCPLGWHDRRNLTQLPDQNIKLSFQCDACPGGSYSNVSLATTDRVCQQCPEGKYSSLRGQTHSSTCLDCGAGKYNQHRGADHESKCLPCPAGFQSLSTDSRAKPCKACPIGRYIAARGSFDVCKKCPAGYAQRARGRASCDMCLPGFSQGKSEESACKACGLGKFANSTTMLFCVSCPAGFHQPWGKQAACLACIPGQFTDGDSMDKCKECPQNWFQNDVGAMACDRCPEARKAIGGSARCSLCKAGKYFTSLNSTPDILTSACETCPAGYHQPEQGEIACEECAIGRFSEKGSPGCAECELGKFGSVSGEASCSDCPTGKYQDKRGETTCVMCEADTYMDGEASDEGAASKSACKPCERVRTTSGKTGCTNETSCLCKRVEFFTNTAMQCEPCPIGANCSSQDGSTCYTIFPQPGFWRRSNDSTEFLSCASARPGIGSKQLAKQRCCPLMVGKSNDGDIGGGSNVSSVLVNLCNRGASYRNVSNDREWHADFQCAHGYKGPLCMICDRDHGYLRKGDQCEYCSAGKSDPIGAVSFLAACCTIVLIVMFIVATYTKNLSYSKERNQLHDLDRDSIKILIGYMQIISVLTQSFSSTSWPQEFKVFSASMSFVNFDIGFFMPFATCTLSVPFTIKLIIHLISPIAFLLAVKAGTKLAMVVNCKGERSEKRAQAQNVLGDTIMINLCLLMYPGIATVSKSDKC